MSKSVILKWLGILTIPVMIYAAGFMLDWHYFLRSSVIPTSRPVEYILKPGASVYDLARDLHRMGLLQQPTYFVLLARLNNSAAHLHAGEYRFMPGITAEQMLDQIVHGRVLYRRITFIEGWTFKQVMTAINKNPFITHTLDKLDPMAIMEKLGYPNTHPEGLFFPDTYKFTRGTTDKTVLRAAYHTMTKRLATAWSSRAEDLPYTNPYIALIVASMVEKEARVEADRPKISGVILHRLEKNMPLQIDPTVIYGVGDRYTGILRKVDLKEDTPYNTYTRKGLPPTPISMPSLKSIQAALHPEMAGHLFFVVKPNGGGSHKFSATLKEHNEAVKAYRAKQAVKKAAKKTSSSKKKAVTTKTPAKKAPAKAATKKKAPAKKKTT